MSQLSLRYKLLLLVLGFAIAFACLSLSYLHSEYQRLNHTAAEYRLSILIDFLTHQFSDALLDSRVKNNNNFRLRRVLNACKVINKYNSNNIKIAIFDANLNFVDGNNLDDSFKIGVLYQAQKIKQINHFLRATGPLIVPNIGIIGYYKIDFNNKYISDNSKEFIRGFFIFTVSVLFFLLTLTTLLLSRWILPTFELKQRHLETMFSNVSELLASLGEQLTHWSQQKNSRSRYAEELMERSDNLKLSLHSSQNILQQNEELLEEFENSLKFAMTALEKLQKTQQTLKMIIVSGDDSIQQTTKLAIKKEVFTMNAIVEAKRSNRNTQGLAVLIDEIHKTDKNIIDQLGQIHEDFQDINAQVDLCDQSKDLLIKHLSELTHTHKQNSKRLLQMIKLANSHSKSNFELYSNVKILHEIGVQDLIILKQIDQNNAKLRGLQRKFLKFQQSVAEIIDSDKEDNSNE